VTSRALAGKPRAARAVGNIMRTCGEPGVPCHRVIGAGGSLGGYGGNLQMKRQLLRAEGLESRDGTHTRFRTGALASHPE
jgi:O6-methylguanine-DNA--protein-cysteine methyltransferase